MCGYCTTTMCAPKLRMTSVERSDTGLCVGLDALARVRGSCEAAPHARRCGIRLTSATCATNLTPPAASPYFALDFDHQRRLRLVSTSTTGSKPSGYVLIHVAQSIWPSPTMIFPIAQTFCKRNHHAPPERSALDCALVVSSQRRSDLRY